MQYASPWSRFLSAGSDIIIVRLLLDLLSLAIPSTWLVHKQIVFAAFAASILVTYFITRLIFRGQTIGMWLFGYRVVKSTKSKRLTWFEETLRFLSQWISILLFFLPFAYSLLSKKNRHFSDLVVDSVPEKNGGRFEAARPFQRFLGILLIVMAINGILAGVQKGPAIDLFGTIFKGEIARGIHISLALFCGVTGFVNIYGKKRAAHTAAALYLVLLTSATWSLLKFDIYQQRVTQNLRETLNAANSQTQQPLSERMLKGLVQDTDKYMQANLKSATKANLLINALCFFYMLYLVFLHRLHPYQQKLFAFTALRFDKVYNWLKAKIWERDNEKT